MTTPHVSFRRPGRNLTPASAQRAGFALVVSVAILLLLAVIAVGLLTLSSITIRTSTQGAAQAEARANARLALLLALGDLQKALGPDQRISARAETLSQHPSVGAPVGSNTPRSWWVGAAHSDPESDLTPDDPEDARAVAWLVSGLDPNASSAAQLGQQFQDPVEMYGDKTIDLAALTGGQPIEAGTVFIADDSGRTAGGLAWFIDDDGMKAQLAPTDPELRNDRRDTLGGGVIPGAYNVGILNGMESLDGVPLEQYTKLQSLRDLPLIGADLAVVRDKHFSYTTLSRGVLADVREGGLKKDLTIAFERDEVFANVFPNNPARGTNFGDRFVVMDREKFLERGNRELQENGYIHWEMFKDFYNTKRHIGVKGGRPYLDAIMITKEGLFNGPNTPFRLGTLGPHEIGDNSSTTAMHRAMPYGDYSCITTRGNTENYKHSPLIPVLARMQQNAWLERRPPPARGQPEKLRTNVQLWMAQYNPYNIGLNVLGDGTAHGPRILHYPQVYISHPGVRVSRNNGPASPLNRAPGFSGKRQTHVPHEVLLGPGRSHVYAFKDYAVQGQDNDGLNYEDRVRDLTLQSIYVEYDLVSASEGTMTVDFILERPSMMHGANSNSTSQASHEVSQTMWAPFAFEPVNGQPGKRITIENVSPRELNENNMASFAFNLRTTREPDGSSSGASIRPLVDANIRALMCNTRWDSPLGLDVLAAYSGQNEGVTDEQIFQMDTRDAPKGYTYWGGGLDPLNGYDRVILFDVPREDLVSIGQLQHANIGRFSYEPTYIVGNSYANLRIPQTDWKASVRDSFSTADRGLASQAIPRAFQLYDASYLVNEVLFDGYVFTTLPQVRDNYDSATVDLNPNLDSTFEGLLDGSLALPNPRFIPYVPDGSAFDRETLQEPSGLRGATGGFYHNAGHLMVDGAFNVNSTSVDAWEAFLSGTYELPHLELDDNGKVTGFASLRDVNGVRFPRVKAVLGEGRDKDALDENYWTGFRALSREEVRELAEAIVEEIRKRGPFLTMGEFVNRKLETGDLGQRGALQAALDATVNSGIDSDLEEAARMRGIPEGSTQGAGFPGQLLQGDILQALSPMMSARSDTFTIRAYGESRVPGTGEIRARAWCEATVQRFPDPVKDGDANRPALSELVSPTSAYGRTFRMVSFRWLSPNEI